MNLRLPLGLLAAGLLSLPNMASAAPEDSTELDALLSDDATEPQDDPVALEPEAGAGADATAGTTSASGSSGRPWSLQGGIGPMVNLEGAGAYGKLPIDFQYHFLGGDTGPALGAQMAMNFRPNIFGMDLGPIFLWDFKVLEKGNFKMYAAPLVALGYSFMRFSALGLSDTGHGFFMDFGGQVKGLFNDRIGFYARPLNFSLLAGQGGATGFWSMVGGVSAAF